MNLSQKRKTKASDLARIRNNQRRSRARRKDYIAELEEKLQKYESPQHQNFPHLEIQDLLKENELLKKLLQSLGLDQDFLKSYSQASTRASDLHANDHEAGRADRLATPGTMQTNLTFTMQLPGLGSHLTEDVFETDASMTDTSLVRHGPIQFGDNRLGDTLTPTTISLSAILDDSTAQTHGQSQPTQSSVEMLNETTHQALLPENTTLCSLAFSLLMSNNRKGYSAVDLDLKLRAGYMCGASTSEGCRIDNKVLFSVLAEIS